MSYTEEGKLKKVLAQYTSFNEPGEPIPAKITEITGITDVLVKGHKINWDFVNHILDESDIVVAHNADFDRGWAEEHGNAKKHNWHCSVSMVEWKNKHGFAKSKLEYLKEKHNIEAPSHRALDDVRTLVKVLKQPSKSKPEITYFQELLRNGSKKRYEVHCIGSKYQQKDQLRNMGFYWNAEKKLWKRKCTDNNLDEIKEFLDNKIKPKKVKIKEVD